jgi:hypothetical protein
VIVRVDPSADTVEVAGADDLRRLAVVVPAADVTAAGEVLAAHGAGSAGDEGHVWLDAGWLRRAGAAAATGDGFEAGFDGMLAYAGAHGFLSDDGASVRAHVVASGA